MSSTSSCPEQSAQDERLYRNITLANGLQCLLISDPTTDKASAALDVRVGHLCDPIPGLAHFLEHMLFLGTEKYPDENSYNKYLNENGGSSNAFTDMESTNYFFDVSAEYLEGALDRFAQCFISPLFTPSATEREMNAVDSEHAKNLQSDFWRTFQLSKSLCRPEHPFSKFGSGNLETLNVPDVRTHLLAFHKTYYSANVMKLALLGKETLDELESIVSAYFADIPNYNLSVPSFPGTPFTRRELGRKLQVLPVRETRSVELSWPMREIDTLYLSKPTRYLSHLIGHEGSGSILSLLKRKHWANELSAGESRTCSDWSSFTISIELTESGLEHVDDVVEIVYCYLSMLKDKGPQKWIYQEITTVADMSFRFLSKRNPMDYTCSLAGAMHLYPEEHILSGPYKIFEYDPTTIEQCLSYLKPENMLIMILAKEYDGKTTLNEHWYGTDYSMENITKDLITKWDSATVGSNLAEGTLHFPEQNDMIAGDFSLVHLEEFPINLIPKDEPRLILNSDKCRVWYKPDNVFLMPKVNIMAHFRTTAAYESPEAAVLSSLWVNVLQEHCNEFSYLASMAGLHCSFMNSRTGIEINVSGYNDKANILVKHITDAMSDLSGTVTNELFDRIKDKVMIEYQNFYVSHPYQHAIYGADMTLEMSKWSVEEKIKALEQMTINDLVEFSSHILSSFYLELLVHGNVTPEKAEAVASVFLQGLDPLATSDLPQLRVVQLQNNTEYTHRLAEYNKENSNGSIVNIYQMGPMDLPENAILGFVHHLIKEPAFNELRSEEQLGYIVHTSVKTSGNTVKGLLFLIQSDAHDPIHLDERIEAFLDRFRSKLLAMSPQDFQSNIDAVVKTYLEKNKNLGEESTKYWNVITNETYIFQKFALLAAEVQLLTPSVVLEFFDKYLRKGAPERKKLSVQVFAQQHVSRMEENVVACRGQVAKRNINQVDIGQTPMCTDDDDACTSPRKVIIPPDALGELKRQMTVYPVPEPVNLEHLKLSKDERT